MTSRIKVQCHQLFVSCFVLIEEAEKKLIKSNFERRTANIESLVCYLFFFNGHSSLEFHPFEHIKHNSLQFTLNAQKSRQQLNLMNRECKFLRMILCCLGVVKTSSTLRHVSTYSRRNL